MSNISNSAFHDLSNSPFYTPNKAIFTIHSGDSQILVVNAAACQVLNYNSDELCSMKLEDLVLDSCKSKWSNILSSFSQDLVDGLCTNERLVELVSKTDEIILVALCLKRVDSPHKCLVIAEPIERKRALVCIDGEGQILSNDEEAACLFHYDVSELVGLNVDNLLPSLNFLYYKEQKYNEPFKQYTTGRAKTCETFPVCVVINCSSTDSEEYDLVIWTYLNLNGLFVLNEDFLLTKFNRSFVKLLFGYTCKDIVNEPIINFIPSFCKDYGDYDSDRRDPADVVQSAINELNLNLSPNRSRERKSESLNKSLTRVNFLASFKSRSRPNSHRSFRPSEHGDESGDDEPRHGSPLRRIPARRRPIYGSDDGVKTIAQFPSLDQANRSEDEAGDRSDVNPVGETALSVTGVNYIGLGKHNDGTYIDIKYHVRKLILNDEVFYSVWVSSELPKFTGSGSKLNLSGASSINSRSMDSIITRDSIYSEHWTRPSSASACHSDEILTAGSYYLHYTNIVEINKRACGYVKMAFRNSDGLLVITKFIKKQKSCNTTWIYNSDLDMTIPLEISFLTALEHPNVVKVLDVFQNEAFVQLVMEKHGAGLDLFEFIDRGLNCDEKLRSYIFRQIVSAVHYLDSLGILHRDIKDENVIINEKFEVKLIDFGSAAFMSSDENFSKFYGTVEYCSPEVLLGNSYRGPELEIWALGVTLYILAFGENPFCDIEESVKGEFSILSPITDDLRDLLHRMLDKNVETRITIGELVENKWINQPVSVENYKFEEVVSCYEHESRPPKYVYELPSSEHYMPPGCPDDVPDTNGSSRSRNNSDDRPRDDLTELNDDDDDDDKFFEIQKFKGVLSSTPVKRRNFRPCKSAHL